MKRIAIALIAGALILAPIPAMAAEPAQTGVTVSPSQQDVGLSSSQERLVLPITLTNHNSFTQEFSMTAIDFGGLDDSGGLVFLGQNSRNSKYGLANWIELPSGTVQLGPGKSEVINAIVKDRSDLSPGAHYGGVVFTKGGDALSATNQLSLRQSLVSLVFLIKDGAVEQGMELTKFEHSPDWWSKPSVTLGFKNTGNSFIVPRGYVQLLDPQGREVMRAAINENSARILPEATRTFKISPSATGATWLPGKYRLVVSYRYDGKEAYGVREVIIYKSLTTLIGVGIGVVILVLILSWFLWRNRHWSKLPRRRKPSN